MSWFKVDDKLHDHRKARRVRRSSESKHRDVAPFGIWVLAGSWAGANNTAGFVPLEVLQDWDDNADELANRLVDAGLWEAEELDGEPGYRFHDWADMNPLSGDDRTGSGLRGNHIRWHEQRGVTVPGCSLCFPDDRGDIPPDVADESGGDIGTDVLPDSSRPDPTRPDPTRERARKRAATRRPPDFIPTTKHLALAAELGVDLRSEWPHFCDHHDAKDSRFVDWGKALNTWIRNVPKFAGNGAGNVQHLPFGGPDGYAVDDKRR